MLPAFRQLLEEITGKKAAGPSPTFSLIHMLRALELIAETTVGRSRLAEELEVGEGTARTIVNRLKDAGLITTSRKGCTLTDKGLELWNCYKAVFPMKVKIGKNELTVGEYNYAILVKDCGHKVTSGMKQRDAAVMMGAGGATTMTFKQGRLVIPSVSSHLARDFPNAANQIIKLLQPEENDVVVIGSANSSGRAEFGALAAAWTLFDNCG